MNAAEAAALIAAVFWALLVSVGVFVLFRLGRLLAESSRLVADLRERSDMLTGCRRRARSRVARVRRDRMRPGMLPAPSAARSRR